jgi:hypothetical protein
VDKWECVEGCPVLELDRQSGQSHANGGALRNSDKIGYGGGKGAPPASVPNDSGTASRFFKQCEWDPELDDSVSFYYCAKANRTERDRGLEYFRARTAAELTNSEEEQARLNSPRTGAGRTGGARNPHPTVKPVELLRWLVRLICPPGGTVLDPFAGSGSCGVAATLEGRGYFGIELNDSDEEPFVSVARARIAWAEGRVVVPRESLRSGDPPRQVGMFEVER